MIGLAAEEKERRTTKVTNATILFVKMANNKSFHGSADSAFLGDPQKFNPEELFIAAISSCHMLWYLHLCANNGIIVTEYADSATGTMLEKPDGGGHFQEVILQPIVTVEKPEMVEKAKLLHLEAYKKCFIANS